MAAVKRLTTCRHALYPSHSQSGSSDCVFHEKYAFWLIGMRISRMGGVTTRAHAYFSRNTQSELQKAPFSRNTRFGCRQPPPVTDAKKSITLIGFNLKCSGKTWLRHSKMFPRLCQDVLRRYVFFELCKTTLRRRPQDSSSAFH